MWMYVLVLIVCGYEHEPEIFPSVQQGKQQYLSQCTAGQALWYLSQCTVGQATVSFPVYSRASNNIFPSVQ